MRLYHFTRQTFGLEAIRDRRLKVARIAELNDPFDVMAPISSRRIERATWKGMRQGVHDFGGLLCFSAAWHNPLLWAHYADNHRGVCLGFDVERTTVTQVKYLKERPTVEMAFERELLLAAKFDAWSYEDEWRNFVRLVDQDPDPVSGLHFRSFDETLVLRELIIGDRSTVSRAQAARLLSGLGAVEAKKARPAFKTFQMVEQRDKRIWK